MKKYFLIGLIIAIAPNFCFGAGARYTQLVREKQRKMEELEKCMGSTQGLKIAGLSTLGLTAVGVAGNVAEAKKLDEYESGIKSKEKELEKIQEDIAEKQAEINKAKEEAEAAAAAQKKAEEEARNLYKTNCSKTFGTLDSKGMCICNNNSNADEAGFCKREIEVVSVNPTVAGSELTGVVATNNNLFTWNPVATNDEQDNTGSQSGSVSGTRDVETNSQTNDQEQCVAQVTKAVDWRYSAHEEPLGNSKYEKDVFEDKIIYKKYVDKLNKNTGDYEKQLQTVKFTNDNKEQYGRSCTDAGNEIEIDPDKCIGKTLHECNKDYYKCMTWNNYMSKYDEIKQEYIKEIIKKICGS